jgi:hypothetical protein
MSKQQQNNIYKMKYFFAFYFFNNHKFIFNKKMAYGNVKIKKKYNAGKNVVHIVRQPGKIYGLALYVIVMKNDRKIQLEYNKIWHLNENEHVPA